MKIKKFAKVIKIIAIQLIFLLLHYLYDWFPNSITKILSGINESVYQHMKIGFFSYILFFMFEFILIKKPIKNLDSHIISRLFSAVFFPLVMMVIYLVSPLLIDHTQYVIIEILFANLALIATSFSTLIVEEHIESINPNCSFKITVYSLFVISFVQFIVFTFNIPWFDIFAIPPGY